MYPTSRSFSKIGFLFLKEKRKLQLQGLFVEKPVDTKNSIQSNLLTLSPEIDTGYLLTFLNIDKLPFDKRFSFASAEINMDGSTNIKRRMVYDAVIPVKIIFELSAITFQAELENIDSVVILSGKKLITHVKHKPPEWGQIKSIIAIPVQ